MAKDKNKEVKPNKLKEFKKTLKRVFHKQFWIKFLIITSSLILIATSFLPYIL